MTNNVYDFVTRTGLINLGLNVAGIIRNEKNVSIYLGDKEVLTGNMLGQRADNVIGLQAVIMDMEARETSRIMEHPIESGAMIADHKVQDPDEVIIRMVMPYYFYDEIVRELQDYKRGSVPLNIHTKKGIYRNMQLCDIPHIENVSNVSRLTFNLRFRQAMVVQPQYIKLPKEAVKKKKNADTVQSGQKQGQPVKTSVLENISRKLSNWFYKGFLS